MKGFRPKFVFLIIAIAVFCYLAFISFDSRQNFVEDMVSSAIAQDEYTTYKNLFSDLVSSREGTYGDVLESIFTNNLISLGISIVIYVLFIVLGISGIWIPFNGLIVFIISLFNFDTYWLTAAIGSFSFHIAIISAIPIICTIIYSVMNGPERRIRKNAKLKTKAEV